MNKEKIVILLWLFIGAVNFSYSPVPISDENETVVDESAEVVLETETTETIEPVEIQPRELTIVAEPSYSECSPEPIEEFPISDWEIDLIALVTMAEAEGECEEGKRLVVDTILNRVDSVHFPDTVEEVIYQENQFTSMWNGRVDRCYVMDDIRQLVKDELRSRTNYDVVFFTAGDYGEYGKCMFPVGNHYFASYE